MQVWRQPKQAKKGKKGAEPTLSSFSGTVRSLSADLDSVHSTLAGGVKVNAGPHLSDKAGPEQLMEHQVLDHTISMAADIEGSATQV